MKKLPQVHLEGGRLMGRGYALDAEPGYARSLSVLTREGIPVGWIDTAVLGFMDVKEWLSAGASGRRGELQAPSASPRKSPGRRTRK
jgi:hypothetical protein